MKTTLKPLYLSFIIITTIFSNISIANAGWHKVCREVKPMCLTQQRGANPYTGRLVVTTTIRTAPGRQDTLFLKVSRRFSRSDNVILQVDKGKRYKVFIRNCRRDFCIAQRPFTGSLKKSFLRGRRYTVSAASNNDREIISFITDLENFRSVYRLKPKKRSTYKRQYRNDNSDSFDKLFPNM